MRRRQGNENNMMPGGIQWPHELDMALADVLTMATQKQGAFQDLIPNSFAYWGNVAEQLNDYIRQKKNAGVFTGHVMEKSSKDVLQRFKKLRSLYRTGNHTWHLGMRNGELFGYGANNIGTVPTSIAPSLHTRHRAGENSGSTNPSASTGPYETGASASSRVQGPYETGGSVSSRVQGPRTIAYSRLMDLGDSFEAPVLDFLNGLSKQNIKLVAEVEDRLLPGLLDQLLQQAQ